MAKISADEYLLCLEYVYGYLKINVDCHNENIYIV